MVKKIVLGSAMLLGALALVAPPPSVATAQDTAAPPQTLIAPGVYTFQTRLDHSSCGSRSTSGIVRTFVAVINGVPGSREMTMNLLNSSYWSRWTLRVTDEGYVVGDSQQDNVQGANRGDSHFELRLDDGKLSGRGSRSYMQRVSGQMTRCRTSYDTLLFAM